MFKRLLVLLDGFRFSSRAIRYAIEVAQHFGAEIILLQVVKPAASTSMSTPGIGSLSSAEAAVLVALLEVKIKGT